MREIKILIINFESRMNKGALALLNSTIRTIKMFIPNTKFTLLPRVFDYHDDDNLKIRRLKSGISIRKPQYTICLVVYLLLCIFIRFLKELNIPPPIPKKSILFEYYSADIVVNTGGDTLTYGYSSLTPMINVLYGILLRKPIIFYGESLGPFNGRILRLIARFILNRSKLILLRDNISLKYLREIGINKPKIFVTADPAFLLDAAPQSCIYQILSNENMNSSSKPLIGINPSKLIERYNPHYKENLVDIFAKVIDNLVEDLNVNVLLIPHVYGPVTGTDDRIVVKEIFANVKNKSKVRTIKNEYTPQELKGIIGQCDLFIGARMHATIASTSMLIPTVAIAYSDKTHGIIGKMLGYEKYVLDVKDLSYDKLISKIDDAWEDRDVIKKDLEMKIPEIKEKAMLNGKLIKEVVDTLKTS